MKDCLASVVDVIRSNHLPSVVASLHDGSISGLGFRVRLQGLGLSVVVDQKDCGACFTSWGLGC